MIYQKSLLKKVKKSIKEMADEIWTHRKSVLKDYGWKRSDILDESVEAGDTDEYSSFAWEEGYIYALQQIIRELKNDCSNL